MSELSDREYMKVISFYIDWCYINNINDDIVTTNNINNFINNIKNKIDENIVKEALERYFRYLNKEYIVN